ncbi:MAG TPA: TolC family protein [Nitrospirales bacterium]|nr:TolC family protein [Nitrospirales bacterium]
MIRRHTTTAVLTSLLFVWTILPASGQTPMVLTLKKARSLALEHSPLLHASEHALTIAKEDIESANAGRLPTLDLHESYMNTNNPTSVFGTLLNQGRFTENDFDVDRLVSPGSLDNYRFDLSLNQSIYQGNRTTLGIKRARLGADVSRARVEETKQHVLYRVTEAYYDILLAKAQVKTAQEAETIARTNLRHIQSRFDAGVTVKSDVLEAAVRLSSVREALIVAQRSVKVARAVLQHTIGLREAVDVEGDLNLIHALSRTRADDGMSPLESRPDYQALQGQLDQAEVGTKLAKSSFLPSVDIQSIYERNTAGPFSNGESNYSVFAVFRLNLFSGLSDRANVRRSLAQVKRQQQLLEAKRREIAVEVAEARFVVEAAEERNVVTEGTVEQAEENLRIVRNRYRSGIAPVIDLLTAEMVLNKAKLQRLNARYDLHVGLARQSLVQGQMGLTSVE